MKGKRIHKKKKSKLMLHIGKILMLILDLIKTALDIINYFFKF